MQSHAGAIKAAAKRIGISVEAYKAKRASGQKRCWRCRSWKLVEAFGRNKRLADGLSAACLECNRRAYTPRERGPSPLRGIKMSDEAKRKMAAAHRGSQNHRWKGGLSLKKNRNPLETLAKRAVNHAIEAGYLATPKRLPCFDCGKKAKEYHHHRGYEQAHWLEVQALCRKCHNRRHR